MSELPDIIQEIRARLVEQFCPQRILLFGSWAKGMQTLQSDIDVLVVTKTPVSLNLQVQGRELFFDYPVKIDVLFCTEEDVRTEGGEPYSFMHTILRHVIKLYEVDTV